MNQKNINLANSVFIKPNAVESGNLAKDLIAEERSNVTTKTDRLRALRLDREASKNARTD